MPLGLAPAAYVLFTRVMQHNPRDPHWPDRDRFVLSAGHGSMLLYAAPAPLGLRRDARRHQAVPPAGSRARRATRRFTDTAGRRDDDRPARPGLRQRGRAWRWPSASCASASAPRSATTASSAICSDGDLMEGVASEAASIAGHLGLGRLRLPLRRQPHHDRRRHRAVVRHRGRRGALRAPTAGTRSTVEDAQRPRRRSRPRSRAGDGRGGAPVADPRALDDRLRLADARPAPRGAHGDAAAATTRCARRRRRSAGIPTRTSSCPTASTSTSRAHRARRRGAGRVGAPLPTPGRTRTRSSPTEWDAAWAGRPLPGLAAALPTLRGRARRSRRAPRAARCMQAIAPFLPTMVGGAADLDRLDVQDGLQGRATPTAASTPAATSPGASASTRWARPSTASRCTAGSSSPTARRSSSFADYMRPAIRLSALMSSPCVWIFIARLGRARRGRPDAPAGRAPRRAARDPGADGDPPERRERDGRSPGA